MDAIGLERMAPKQKIWLGFVQLHPLIFPNDISIFSLLVMGAKVRYRLLHSISAWIQPTRLQEQSNVGSMSKRISKASSSLAETAAENI